MFIGISEKKGTVKNNVSPRCPGGVQPTRPAVKPCRGRKCSVRKTSRQRIRVIGFRKLINYFRKITSRRSRRRRQRRR